MMNLSDILFVTDCDGTLLQDDKTIAPEDFAAIREFRAAGGNFVVATGRSIPTGGRLLRELDLDLPSVLYNGSMLYDSRAEKILLMTEIPAEARFLVREALNRFSGTVGSELLTPEGLRVIAMNELVDAHLNGAVPIPHTEASWEDLLDAHWLKVMFAMSEEQLPEFSAFLRSFSAKGVRFVRAERLFFEILPADASKGGALKRLCDMEGLELSRTVALGDCDNDVEMLQEARVGIAVSNAFPELKAAADLVTVSNEEHAVSVVLRELMKDPEGFFNRYGKECAK